MRRANETKYLVMDTFIETDVEKDFKKEHFDFWLGVVVGSELLKTPDHTFPQVNQLHLNAT